MDNNRIIKNLEALLDGYLTSSGESVENNIIINDRETIRTFQTVIHKLRNNIVESDNIESKKKKSEIEIKDIVVDDYIELINLLKFNNINPTKNRLRKFFAGRYLKDYKKLIDNDLFGKYEYRLTGRAIYNQINQHWKNIPINQINNSKNLIERGNVSTISVKANAYVLKDNDINNYKNIINNLGMHKVENSQILMSRIKFKRAYESWCLEEDAVLKELISMEVSLEQIAEILLRSKSSIESRLKNISAFNI